MVEKKDPVAEKKNHEKKDPVVVVKKKDLISDSK